MAIGVIRGVRRAGVRVPEDVSVIGFDNVALAEIVDPELTAVAAPLRTMGIIGINHLITMIGGATPSRDPIVLPVKLIVRGSTGRRRRRETWPASGAPGDRPGEPQRHPLGGRRQPRTTKAGRASV